GADVANSPHGVSPPATEGVEVGRMFLEQPEVTAPAIAGRIATLTVDRHVQQAAMTAIRNRRLPSAGVAMMDLRTGRLVVYASRTNGSATRDLLASADAPAGDVFQLVIAAALIERHKLSAETPVCYRDPGKKLELEDLVEDAERDTWCPTLAEALGRNLGPPLARIALRRLDNQDIHATASSFGFGFALPFDFAVQPSSLQLPTSEDGFVLSAIGQGNVTLSPMQALLMASTIATKGVMLRPVVVSSVKDAAGNTIYRAPAAPRVVRRPIGPDTALALAAMMRHTVEIGTAFRAFHDDNGHPRIPEAAVAGVSAATTRAKDKQHITWFVGFAPYESPRIAISAIAMHQPSAEGADQLVADVLRAYFDPKPNHAAQLAADM
ncbi:MAG: penicillin-binding transpeptidase domain-containing protein, partial [Polyangiaceae bacterium]|nr:penicillin-binding transpeptidase domain-containing protein [Polyangiaceae bacterium]